MEYLLKNGETVIISEPRIEDAESIKAQSKISRPAMKKFDENYILLEDMVNDEYYPEFLVDKLKELIIPVIILLENGETNTDIVQSKLDEMTLAINELQEEFYDNDSEIETVARDSIAVTIGHIMEWFSIDIDMETALRERDW